MYYCEAGVTYVVTVAMCDVEWRGGGCEVM